MPTHADAFVAGRVLLLRCAGYIREPMEQHLLRERVTHGSSPWPLGLWERFSVRTPARIDRGRPSVAGLSRRYEARRRSSSQASMSCSA